MKKAIIKAMAFIASATILTGTVPSVSVSASNYSAVGATAAYASIQKTAEREILQAVPTTRALYYGRRGNDVKALQQVLAVFGYYKDSIDSHFGKNTKAAVMEFQRANGLAVDGSAGAKTLSCLNKKIEEYNSEILEARKALEDEEPAIEIENSFPSQEEISAYFASTFEQMYFENCTKEGFKAPSKTQKTGPNAGAYSFKGYCGLYVADRLLTVTVGVFEKELDVNVNGNQWYNTLYSKFSGGNPTSGGYTCKFYANNEAKSVGELLKEIAEDGHTARVLLSFPKQSDGGTAYGHCCYIDFLNGDEVWWSDSYILNSTPEGWEHHDSIQAYARHYSMYGTPKAVVFTK